MRNHLIAHGCSEKGSPYRREISNAESKEQHLRGIAPQMGDGRSDEAQDNQRYQEENHLAGHMFQTHDGTQYRSFDVKA